ncbi:hypothetical protein NM432_03860 [Vibrio metschnikovii]
MTDYGVWTLLTPLVTIALAVLTRQVILSLLIGAVVGYTVIAGFNPLAGIADALDSYINVFASAGNTRTILFCFMVGGIIRLIQITGGNASDYSRINRASPTGQKPYRGTVVSHVNQHGYFY